MTQYPFTEQKQKEAKVKVRETSQQGVRFLFFPVTIMLADCSGKGPLLLLVYLPTSSNYYGRKRDGVMSWDLYRSSELLPGIQY